MLVSWIFFARYEIHISFKSTTFTWKEEGKEYKIRRREITKIIGFVSY